MQTLQERLDALKEPFAAVDAGDWARLEASLAKDESSYGHFWRGVLKDFRAAIEAESRIAR